MSCAKMAELIDLSFGLSTQVGWRKHKFNHIHEVALVCPRGRAYWCQNWLNCPSAATMRSYVKLLWPLV